MAPRTDIGCSTPKTSAEKDVHRRLLNIFSPLLHFDSQEQFFPVDLPTTVTASSLCEVDVTKTPPGSTFHKKPGQIDANVLLAANRHHYTTVAADPSNLTGTGSVTKTVNGKKVTEPAPLLQKVMQAYAGGAIPAELTMYGTVCRAADVPGASVVSNAVPRDGSVVEALKEGLLLNYFFYFPARQSPEFESEGDWSGITLLLRRTPTTSAQLNNASELKRCEPVLCCYYRKTVDGAPPSPHFVAGTTGFRRWKDVTRGQESSVGLDTHPHVYISRGRHNCLYAPATSNIPLSPPWGDYRFSADSIEKGGYAPGPGSNTLEGGPIQFEDVPWWGYVLFPPLVLFVACASGCEYPVHFDSSGLPGGFQDGEDRADKGGYEAHPASQGSSHPNKPAGQATGPGAKTLTIRLRYVDLDDADTAGQWGYQGAWGAATKTQAVPVWDPGNAWIEGDYQGARRPILPAWFMWNLFLDSTYGCSGDPQLTRMPF